MSKLTRRKGHKYLENSKKEYFTLRINQTSGKITDRWKKKIFRWTKDFQEIHKRQVTKHIIYMLI